MKDSADVLDDAMDLSPAERARLVNELLSSLNQADEEVDRKWKEEVKDRIQAAEEGDLQSIPLDEVLSKYEE